MCIHIKSLLNIDKKQLNLQDFIGKWLSCHGLAWKKGYDTEI